MIISGFNWRRLFIVQIFCIADDSSAVATGIADVAGSMKIASETLRGDIPRIIAEANQQVLKQAA
jgi:hypothetical protein